MNRSAILIGLIFIFLFPNIMSAQSKTAPGNEEIWNSLINQKAGLGLSSYGHYANGREIDRQKPSKRNHNRDECLVLGNRHIWWLYSADGNFIFDYHVEGNKLVLTNRRRCNKKGNPISVSDGSSTYLQMIEYKYIEYSLGQAIITDILTVDNISIYRHFIPVTDY